MIRNYIIVAIRNLVRSRVYTLISVTGLSVGLAVCLLVGLYAVEEFKWNRGLPNGDRLYRVVLETRSGDGNRDYMGRVSGGLAHAIRESIPEAESVGRLMRRQAWIATPDGPDLPMTFAIADPEFVRMIGLDPATAGHNPSDPHGILLSPQAYRRLGEPAAGNWIQSGSTVWLYNGGFRVDGVITPPEHSTVGFDLLATAARHSPTPSWYDRWTDRGWRYVEVYLTLRHGTDVTLVETKLHDLMARHHQDTFAATSRYHLQPYEDIYLHSAPGYGIRRAEFDQNGMLFGDITDLKAFGSVALAVLILACINFVNLTTARSIGRAREVGLRKVTGATRARLIRQFLTESVVLALAAGVVAVFLVEMIHPRFTTMLQIAPSSSGSILSPTFALAVGLISVVTGLVAGAYPAIYLSRLAPVQVLRGVYGTRPGTLRFRKALVIFQFAVSIVLIVGTVVVRDQMDHLRYKDLGYDQHAVLQLPLFRAATGTVEKREVTLPGGEKKMMAIDISRELKLRYNTVKDAFLARPDVISASVARFRLGDYSPTNAFYVEGRGDDPLDLRVFPVDEDFLDCMKIPLTRGRGFTRSEAALPIPLRLNREIPQSYILNEAAVRALGWDDPLGKRLAWVYRGNRLDGNVVGVVEDFHFQSLRETVKPVILTTEMRNLKYLFLRVRTDRLDQTLQSIEETWERFLPSRPFEFAFLDDELANAFRAEQRLQDLLTGLAAVATFIACLGLFGLSAHDVSQRQLEIGVRKVLGASDRSIASLVTWRFVRLVVIASLVATPVAFYAVRSWLDGFAYRTDLGAGIFLASILIAVAVAVGTVSAQSLRAALSNPVDVLRRS